MIIGFAGSGNMVAAIARGWAGSGHPPERMLFTDSGSGRAEKLAGEVGGEALDDNSELAERSDVVVLGFKPKDVETAAAELQAATAVLSVLNATPLDRLRRLFPGAEVFRLMPNLGVEYGQGVMGLVQQEETATGRELRTLLDRLGNVFLVEDEQIDAVTAVAGCSPAYFEVFVETLAEAGTAAGLDAEDARRMAIEAMAGTAPLLRVRNPGELRRQVASPGGSTEAGLTALSDARFEHAVTRAAEASIARARGEI